MPVNDDNQCIEYNRYYVIVVVKPIPLIEQSIFCSENEYTLAYKFSKQLFYLLIS